MAPNCMNAIHFVTKGGKLVVYGVYNDKDRVPLLPNIIFKEIHVLGSFSQIYKFLAAIDYLGTCPASCLYKEWVTDEEILWADGKRIKVDRIVNKTFKLEEWQACLDTMRIKLVAKAAIVSD